VSELAVVARGLRKHFGMVTALAGLDLTIERGSVFGLLGPNGAGKSTTFNILCGFLHASAGEAVVLGVPSRAAYRLRGRLSALPQDAAFPPQIPVWRQLAHYAVLAGLGRAQAGREARRVLAAVGMEAAAERAGRELSHGMLKRVGLAQALVGSPELVFLDEPTAGLDPAAARQVKDAIISLAPRATIVISSHNLAEIQEICTHGAILDRGRLVSAGTISELTRRGSEVAIELGPEAKVPLESLQACFGPQGAVLDDPQTLHVVGVPGVDAADTIAQALRILLDARVPILGVRRGTSLEQAYLEVTQGSGRAR
jgi:ABC-2 type transport system ATP-binding protein